MRTWLFNIGDQVVINQQASTGLPTLVGQLAEVSYQFDYGTFEYLVNTVSGTSAKVRECELNKVDEDDFILKINMGDRVVKPNGEEAEIIMIDYLYKQVEIRNISDDSMEVISIEKFLDYKKENNSMSGFKFNVGDRVRIVGNKTDIQEFKGKTTKIIKVNNNIEEYLTDLCDHCYFTPNELEIVNKNGFKFNVGDKVRVDTYDEWNGKTGVIFLQHSTGGINHYDVVFDKDNKTCCFGEEELELTSSIPNLKLNENGVIVEDMEEEGKLTDKELHKQILDEIHNTYVAKNADYGNSFGDQFNEYGLLSAVIRLDDKFRRLKQLMKQEAQVKDESIRDTVLDAANYAIMTVMELDKANESKN